MAITFSQLPQDKRVPGQYVEVDNSKAIRGLQLKPLKVLLLGAKVAAGTLPQKTRAKAASADQVRGFAGPASMLHGMALAWFAQSARPIDVEVMPLDDAGGGVAAALNLTVGIGTVGAGSVSLLIAGRLVRAAVAAGDTANTIATSIRNAVNATEGLPVTASGAAATVTLTAVNKGTEGNTIDVRLNYFDGEALPSGVTVSGTGTLAAGATNPTIDAATIAAFGDQQFDVIVSGFSDSANLATLATELTRRFGPEVPLQGRAFFGKRDTHGNLLTFGAAQNSPHFTAVGNRLVSRPHPPWEEAAAVAAVWGASIEAHPVRPVQYREVAYILPGKSTEEWTTAERELLLRDGIATTIAQSGVVLTERLITMYQVSPAGAPDLSFYDSETLAGIAWARWSWANRLKLRFPNHLLADDDTAFGEGLAIVTPSILRGEFAAWYREAEAAGIFEKFDEADRDSIFERNAGDVNRADMLLAVNFTNGFRVGGTLLQFRL